MKQFKRLMEIAGREGVYNIPNQTLAKLNSNQKEILDTNEVFIFKPVTSNIAHIDVNEDDIVDAPFPVFSYEIAGDAPITREEPNQSKTRMWCIICIEVEPKKYDYFCLVETIYGYNVLFIKEGSGETQTSINSLTHTIFKRLAKETTGIEPVSIKFKLGTGKGKYFYKLKKIIHVAPTKEQSKTNSFGTREIDWKHRWTVRGTWREIKGMGKNREGVKKVVKGYTWVIPHIKGPKEAPIIKKQRIVTKE